MTVQAPKQLGDIRISFECGEDVTTYVTRVPFREGDSLPGIVGEAAYRFLTSLARCEPTDPTKGVLAFIGRRGLYEPRRQL
jgi:hypothetical protein